MKHVTNPRRGRSRGGKRPQSSKGRNFESSGGDNKVRGSAQQVLDKYLTLARDATSAGDRIAAEGYFQHAEHYQRILNADSSGADSQPRKHEDDRNENTNQPQQEAAAPDSDEQSTNVESQAPRAIVKNVENVENDDNGGTETPAPKPRRRGRPKKSADDGENKSETAA